MNDFYKRGCWHKRLKALTVWEAVVFTFAITAPSFLFAANTLSAGSSNQAMIANQSEYAFSQKAKVSRAESLNHLVQTRSQLPQAIVADYLAVSGKDARIADTLELIREHQSKPGDTHYTLQQRINGLRVYESDIKLAVSSDGAVLSIIDRLPDQYSVRFAPRAATRSDALQSAVARNFPRLRRAPRVESVSGNTTFYRKGQFFYSNPSVEDVLLLKSDGTLAAGFLTFTWSQESNLLYETVLDGNAHVVDNRLRTVADSYRVFDPHPEGSGSIVVDGPGEGNEESQAGWLDDTEQRNIEISGNNAQVYLERNGDGAPDDGGFEIFTENFTTVADLSQEPDVIENQAAAIQNIFYFTNLIHDELYQLGFTETAGNFQEINFTTGVGQSDAIVVEVQFQAGSSSPPFNNAQFTNTPDGTSPRMRMFLFNLSSPYRDAALDSDIIWHEYGHGLTIRMIGGFGSVVSVAVAEGASDALAILMTNDDVVGEYANNNPGGSRSEPYTGYSRTLGDYEGDPDDPHKDGEIYAAAIWRLWEIFQENDLSLDLLLNNFVDGMNFIPPGPDYVDMRDGLLMASSEAIDCHVWKAFADFGMGEGAAFNAGSITESFDLPEGCSPIVVIDPDVPGVPSDFHIETHGGGLNELIWISQGADVSYQIFKSLSPSSGFLFDRQIDTDNIVVHVTENTYYKVRGCNAEGCGEFTQSRLAYVQECGSIGLPPCE